MEDHKKLEFVHKMTKMGLQHYDGGGIIAGNPVTQFGEGLAGQVGGVAGNISNDFTAKNGYQAQSPTGAGTIGFQQAGLASELENESAGGGPNPAQLQYAQNANQIAQTQAATNAQNRALNPGLAARMSGNQAANTYQNAAAGEGIQQAEQQIAAQQQLQGLTGQEQAGLTAAENINSQTAQNNTNATNQTEGGLLNGVGSILGGLFAKGGMIKAPPHLEALGKIYHPHKFADGGPLVVPAAPVYQMPSLNASPPPQSSGSSKNAGSGLASIGGALMGAARGGLMKKGGQVKASTPGEKAKVKGDSYDNDTIPAMLSQGELVIDRDTMADPGPMGQMARALSKHIQAKNGKKK